MANGLDGLGDVGPDDLVQGFNELLEALQSKPEFIKKVAEINKEFYDALANAGFFSDQAAAIVANRGVGLL